MVTTISPGAEPRSTVSATRRALLVCAGLLTGGVFGLALLVHGFGRRRRGRPSGAIVVLGARVLADGSPSLALRGRTEHAVALWQQGLAPLVVLTGGGPWVRPEAEVARDLALALGMPAAACLLESASATTAQNAEFAAQLLAVHGVRDVIVVSDGFHLLRARQTFRMAGLRVTTSPAERPVRHALYWTMREAFALLLAPRLLNPRLLLAAAAP